MISDNIRGTAAVAALVSLAMLASAGVAGAAAIGTPIAVDKANTFAADETVDLLGGDLGEAANFGLVGFDSIRLNAHTNGNIATAHAYVGAAFGNHAAGVDEPEVSYLGKVDGGINVSLPADSRIVFGASTDIGQTDNGDSWTVDGGKLEMQTGGSLPKSERVLRDSKVKYLDLKAMERSMTALSAKWAKTAPANASYDFSDMNRRHITADGDEAHLDIDAAELQGNRVTATLGEKTRLVVNVDAEGADDITLPQLDVDGINHAEYAHWTDKGVIYNLTDSKSEDGQYHGRVGTAGATSSVILAPEADVDASQNVEGADHRQERGHRRRIPPQQRERPHHPPCGGEIGRPGQDRDHAVRGTPARQGTLPFHRLDHQSGRHRRLLQAGRRRVRRGEGHHPVPAVGGEACAPL